jgi:hypothetical protein
MSIQIVSNKIGLEQLKQAAKESFGDMVKSVVDVTRGILAVGGDLHADAESLLLEDGSKQDDLWGINLYPEKHGTSEFVEFESLINIRPGQGNRSMRVEDEGIREKIGEIIYKVVDPESSSG